MIGEVKALVYDLEIINCIPDKKEPPDPKLTYCRGWHDHAGMGISVVCAYDTFTNTYRVFCEDNKEEFAEACSDRLLVTFNGIGFDDKVIGACWAKLGNPTEGFEITQGRPRYDLLLEIRAAGGGGGLDAICKLNGIPPKPFSGAFAPALWQQGKYGLVIDYCLNDVKMTFELFAMACQGAAIETPRGLVSGLRSPF